MGKTTRQAGAQARNQSGSQGHDVIVSMEVVGGLLDGARLDLAPGQNTIIGGRGSAKTTIIELLRHGLCAPPDADASATRARAHRSIVKDNLRAGRVRITVRTRAGVEYVTERLAGEEPPQVFQEGEPVPVAIDDVFEIDAFSQNEIEEIAADSASQLELIDRIAGPPLSRVQKDIDHVLADLAVNAAELVKIDHEIDSALDGARDLERLRKELQGMQIAAGSDAKLLNEAHAARVARDRERAALKRLHEDARNGAREIEARLEALARSLGERMPIDVASGSNRDLLVPIRQVVERTAMKLGRAAGALVEDFAELHQVIEERQSSLAERHAKQDAEYHALVNRSEEESARAAARREAQRLFDAAEASNREYLELSRRRGETSSKRKRLVSRLNELRDARRNLRKGVESELNESLRPSVEVEIRGASDRSAFRKALGDSLKGSAMRFGAIVDQVLESQTAPDELAQLIQADDVARLARRTGLDEEKARKLIDTVRRSGREYELETIELGDEPSVKLKHGDVWKPVEKLSTGQRCTAILSILLHHSERPLLIDQPEDNLDNEFISERVVDCLRRAKGRRQLIFVSHNSNLVVLADSERVFVMRSDGSAAHVERAGSVDDVKEEVLALLEGGRQAFVRRHERYGR